MNSFKNIQGAGIPFFFTDWGSRYLQDAILVTGVPVAMPIY